MRSRTGSGRAAGPALKLKARLARVPVVVPVAVVGVAELTGLVFEKPFAGFADAWREPQCRSLVRAAPKNSRGAAKIRCEAPFWEWMRPPTRVFFVYERGIA